MSTSLVVPTASTPADLSALSTRELRAELARALTMTAEGLAHAADIWSELQRRGEDLPELRSGLSIWMPRIARRQLAAEAVIAFAAQRTLLQRMIGMPLDMQRRFAAGEEIALAAHDARGEIITDHKPLARLTSREVMLAIESGDIRPMSAQVRTLRSAASRTRTRPRSGQSTARIRADKASGLIAIGRSRIEPSDLTDALRALGYRLTRLSTDEPQS